MDHKVVPWSPKTGHCTHMGAFHFTLRKKNNIRVTLEAGTSENVENHVQE